MRLSSLMDKAIQIENKLSECYSKLSELSSDVALSRTLQKLARDEIDHMNILKAGKNYVVKMPALFEWKGLAGEEIEEGIKSCDELIYALENKKMDLTQALRLLYKLEIKFEQVHISNGVEIKEDFLRRMFDALVRGEQEHKEKLEVIIANIDFA